MWKLQFQNCEVTKLLLEGSQVLPFRSDEHWAVGPTPNQNWKRPRHAHSQHPTTGNQTPPLQTTAMKHSVRWPGPGALRSLTWALRPTRFKCQPATWHPTSGRRVDLWGGFFVPFVPLQSCLSHHSPPLPCSCSSILAAGLHWCAFSFIEFHR